MLRSVSSCCGSSSRTQASRFLRLRLSVVGDQKRCYSLAPVPSSSIALQHVDAGGTKNGGCRENQLSPWQVPSFPTAVSPLLQEPSISRDCVVDDRSGGGGCGGTASKSSAAAAIYLEERAPSFDSDLVVVLDMDECLIHSKFYSPHAARLAHQVPISAGGLKRDPWSGEAEGGAEGDPAATASRMWNHHNRRFVVTLPDGDLVQVQERPYMREFLKAVCARFETHIFTAAVQIYADPVLDRLDPTGTLFADRRWYRDSCHLTSQGAFVKDLNRVVKGRLPVRNGRVGAKEGIGGETQWSLERVVLVDNNPLSFMANPDNGVLVKSFYDDPHDTTLLGVMELLDELDSSQQDVRPVLGSKFGIKAALRKVVHY